MVYVSDRTQSAEEKCDTVGSCLKIHPLLLGGCWTTTTADRRQSSALGVCASATSAATGLDWTRNLSGDSRRYRRHREEV